MAPLPAPGKPLRRVLVALLLCSAATVMAARDGVIGSTSTGEISIRLVINQGIQIANLNDMVITAVNQVTEDVVVSQRFCVRANQRGFYTLTASGERSAAFTLSSGNEDSLAFELGFKGDLAVDKYELLKPNVPSRRYPLVNSGANCNGENNAELTVVIPSAQLNRAHQREYRGFLTLTVAID